MKTKNLFFVTASVAAMLSLAWAGGCGSNGNSNVGGGDNIDGDDDIDRPITECTIGNKLSYNDRNLNGIISYEICLSECIAVDGGRNELFGACGIEIREELEYYIHSNGDETRLGASNENCRVEQLSGPLGTVSHLKCYNDDITIFNNEIQFDDGYQDNIYEHFSCSNGGYCAVFVKYGTADPIRIREISYQMPPPND